MQSINLNMIPGSVMPVINLTQFDEGREFALVVNNGSQAADLTGATLLISGRKGDDTAFSYDQTDTVKGNYVIAVNNNTVTIRNTLQMAAASGEVIATLTIKKSAADVSTLNFKIMVQEHPLDGVDISETEIPAIIALAQAQADEAEAWATGEIDGTPVPATAPQYENSAEYWAGQAQQAAQGGLHFAGSCTFAQIPTTGMEVGDMWDITDAFTTDSRFREGAGVDCRPGTNIAWDGTYWDLLATGSPKALPAGGVAGQFIVKNSSADQDASWGSGIYHFATMAAAQAALAGGTIPNGATVLVDEIGGGSLTPAAISNLADVTLTSIQDGQMLVYDNASGKWVNKNIDNAISTTSSNPVKNSVIAAALANGRITFAIDANGKAGYKLDGADTVYPFKVVNETVLATKTWAYQETAGTYTINFDTPVPTGAVPSGLTAYILIRYSRNSNDFGNMTDQLFRVSDVIGHLSFLSFGADASTVYYRTFVIDAGTYDSIEVSKCYNWQAGTEAPARNLITKISYVLISL